MFFIGCALCNYKQLNLDKPVMKMQLILYVDKVDSLATQMRPDELLERLGPGYGLADYTLTRTRRCL